jgi:hypothetical protein
VICYVLQNYSRSNALVVDGETRRLHLKPALDAMSFGTYHEKTRFYFYIKMKITFLILKHIPHAFYS